MRVTVIHNPSAGAARYAREDLIDAIHRAGHETRYRSTRAKKWREVFDRRADMGDLGDLVVAAGGDGTVDKVGVAMAGRGVPVAILPLGTANNIARALGMNLEVESLIAGWHTARPRPFDVGLVHGTPKKSRFLEAVGVGLFPDMLAAKNTLDATDDVDRELTRDLECIAERLAVEQSRKWHVTLDGRDLSGEHLAVEAMNIGSLGPAMCLAPHADPGDGLLDVVTVPAGERDELAAYLHHRLRGDRHVLSLPVTRGRQLVLQGSGSNVHVDGSLRSVDARKLAVRVGIWPHAVAFMV
jgi:diacylglycerol kinase (ATP)